MVESTSAAEKQHAKNDQNSLDSKIAYKEHWDETFAQELTNFDDHGDDGEVWFGKDVQKKTVEYILE